MDELFIAMTIFIHFAVFIWHMLIAPYITTFPSAIGEPAIPYFNATAP